jgi:RimJ/RimL family protein N-acetyltransferase
MLSTHRLRLHPWHDRHRDAFAALHSDADVMADYGGPISLQASDEKFERYRAALESHGLSRWAVETPEGDFIGYSGVMPRVEEDHPLGPHFEIGWRFRRSAWGHGYATESAAAALTHAVQSMGIDGLIAYTGPTNLRSQSVMRKLRLQRAAHRDFELEFPPGRRLMMWVWNVPIELYGGSDPIDALSSSLIRGR